MGTPCQVFFCSQVRLEVDADILVIQPHSLQSSQERGEARCHPALGDQKMAILTVGISRAPQQDIKDVGSDPGEPRRRLTIRCQSLPARQAGEPLPTM
jgi:hypothetical protein